MLINTIINKQKTVAQPTVGLWGWGLNANNQLGDGTTTNRSSPVFIKSDDIFALECGKDFSFYIADGMNYGRLYGWGANNLGQIGDNTTTQKSSPVTLMTDKEFMAISCGETHVASINGQDNYAVCWGQNNFGQLGDGTTTNRSSPIVITSPDFFEISAGSSFTMGIGFSGIHQNELWAWGYGFDFRNPSGGNFSSPIYLDNSPTQYQKLRVGGNYGFVFDLFPFIDELYGFGKNTYGQLGDGSTTDAMSLYPAAMVGEFNIVRPSLSTDGPFTISIKSDGTLWGWGRNNVGQLGLNDTSDRSSPVMISSSSWVYCATGYDHALAINVNGSLWAWGDNRNGQLGDGTTVSKSSMVQIGSGNTYNLVSAGNRFTIASRTS